MDIKYVNVTEATQVFSRGVHIVGWESSGRGRFHMFDEADDSQTAAQLADTIRGTTYYERAHIMFPLPGLKLSNGLYLPSEGFDVGAVIIYYHEGKDSPKDILYCPVSEANVSLSASPCELIGGDIWSGVISVYDGTSAVAAQLAMTLRTGSYFFYGSTIFPEPVTCNNGLYIAGTEGKGEIFYRKI